MVLNELLSAIQNAVKETVSGKTIGIAFSGGVDSSLTAKICKDLGYQLTLLTIGFEGSHDILFSKQVTSELKLPHKILKIDPNYFTEISLRIKQKIKSDNLSWIENCIAFYYVAKLAQSIGIQVVVTANGVDELFCGYNAYREAIKQSEQKVIELMESKLDNELKMMVVVNEISSEFNVKIVQPFLSDNFIKFAKTIPISEKIKGSDDLIRKHIIRELAVEVGVPKISANKRKKALQYGSEIHKMLIKSR